MDSLDRDVLLALQADGRMSNLALAHSLGLSPSAMLGRVRRLERSGAIRGYHATIDPAVLGLTVRAFVVVRLREHSEQSITEFEERIKHVVGVRACYHVTGQFDMLLELALRDPVGALAKPLRAERILDTCPASCWIETTGPAGA